MYRILNLIFKLSNRDVFGMVFGSRATDEKNGQILKFIRFI